MAKAKPPQPEPTASAPESDAAKSSTNPATVPASGAAGVNGTATATTVEEKTTEQQSPHELRPNDVDVLSRSIQVIVAHRLKADLVSLRERLAAFLGVPTHYPNTR